jgi:UDP-N-acetylmuramate dehydrogenase
LESEGIIKVNSGETWLSIHKFCSNNDYYGLEAFSGLPGSIGGAVYGNAGAHGLEIKDVLEKVDCLDLNTKQMISIPVSKLGLDYRTSKRKQEHNLIVVTAYFKISSDPNKQTGNPEEFAKFRKEKQPQGLTTGSFFKNPPGDYAGRLIDAAGLKGYRIGDIMVSDKHANFFLNLGEANSADVIALKDKVQREVQDKFGIKLEAEVQIIEAN